MTPGTAGAFGLRTAEVIQGNERGEDPTGMSTALDHCSSLILVAVVKQSNPKHLKEERLYLAYNSRGQTIIAENPQRHRA